MASDSEATEAGHTRHDVEKCWQCGGMLMGYAGSGSVKQPLQVAVESAVRRHFGDTPNVDRWEALEAVRRAAQPVLEHSYSAFVASRAGQEPEDVLAGALLIAGYDPEGYWLLELDHNNTGTFYTDRGYQSVGSGSPAAFVALGLMSHYAITGRTVGYLKLVAYRTVATCISVLGGPMMVGGDVQLWSSEGGTPLRRASDEELRVVANGVEQWTTLEQESLDRVVVDGAGPQREPDVDLPEALDEG